MNNLDTTYLKPATPILHEWYSLIVDDRGSPDYVAISLYAELFSWFRSLNSIHVDYHGDDLPEIIDEQLVVSYGYLAVKLNLSHERIRKAFVRLESLNLVTRSVKYTNINDGVRNNRLFISFNIEYFASCFRNPNTDIRVGRDDFLDKTKYAESIKVSPRNHGDYIKNKNIIYNRSIKSNFIDRNYSNNSKILDNDKSPLHNTSPLGQNKFVKFGKPKKLSCFYPLGDGDVEVLQHKSGREFSKTAMNEILKDMCRKLTKPEFWSKKGFISYMSKAFKYELRDAVKISNETFRIRANSTEEEKQERKEEEYLTELENNLHVSPEWHLRKKLASTLDRGRAYILLTSLQRVELDKNGTMNLYLNKNVELTQMDRLIILNQSKATHEKYEDGEFTLVRSLEIINSNTKNNYQQERKVELPKTLMNGAEQETLWGRVRSKLQEKYGREIDRAWFSKLESIETKKAEGKKELILIAESNFYKDWIERNYIEDIIAITKDQGYSLSGITI